MLVYVKNNNSHGSCFITLTPGTGDNLLPEDVADGYAGYINYYVDQFVGHDDDECGFEADDNGMYMCTKNEMKYVNNGNMKHFLKRILTYIFCDDPSLSSLPDYVEYKIIDEALED